MDYLAWIGFERGGLCRGVCEDESHERLPEELRNVLGCWLDMPRMMKRKMEEKKMGDQRNPYRYVTCSQHHLQVQKYSGFDSWRLEFRLPSGQCPFVGAKTWSGLRR